MNKQFTQEELKKFIIHAREETYASGKAPQFKINKEYYFENEQFRYQDVYYDSCLNFQGQEVVFYQNHAIWSCSYRGSLKENHDRKIIFPLLQKFLRILSQKTRFYEVCYEPFNLWRYICEGKGDFSHFIGEESIYNTNDIAYHLNYFGGVIK